MKSDAAVLSVLVLLHRHLYTFPIVLHADSVYQACADL